VQTFQRVLALCCITIAMTAIAFAIRGTHWITELENRSWDWRLQSVAASSKGYSSPVKIIVIDQASLDHFAQVESIFWPWPRALYEPVIHFLKRGGARGVAFDILFTEPSSYGVSDDEALKHAIRESQIPIVSALALRLAQSTNVNATHLDALLAYNKKFSPEQGITLKNPNRYSALTAPIQELIEVSAAFGNVSAHPDSDGIFRHTQPWAYFNDSAFYSLPFALYAATSEEKLDWQWLRRFFSDDESLAVQFRGPARTFDTYSMGAVIASFQQLSEGKTPQIDPDEFKGAYVFVGMDAPGLLDLRPTPLSEVFPGVEFNATVLDNLLQQKFITKWSSHKTMFLGAFLAFLAAGICLFLRSLWLQLLGVGALLLVFTVASWQAASFGVWVGYVLPFLLGGAGAFAATAFQYQLEGRQHKFIRDAFKFYVSPAVIDQIVKDPSSLSLGGDRRELSIFFSDIAGFTSISEKMDPQRLVLLLNQFLTAMTDIILKHGGTVDKYVGDAIVAFWNAPLLQANHAQKAVEAAVECQIEITKLADHFQKEFGVRLQMRIGIHTGIVGVGNFGSRERFNYTVIGDAANLASRLEGANKYFGTDILVSDATNRQQMGVIPTRKIADIRVVGKSEPVAVYEPLFDRQGGVLSAAELSVYNQALSFFDAGRLDEAQSLFEKLGHDSVSRVYLSRIGRDCSKLKGGVVSSPWNPTWNLSEK
jgi:adenylate cyclase